jgi:hypothetical protein
MGSHLLQSTDETIAIQFGCKTLSVAGEQRGVLGVGNVFRVNGVKVSQRRDLLLLERLGDLW